MLHAYPTQLAALFMNPVHANIIQYRLWEAEALGMIHEDHGLKLGATQLRLVRELIPVTIEQEDRIRLALLASLEICANSAWRAYADNWLHGPMIKFTNSVVATEHQEEISCRTHAYKAAMYEQVGFNSAMALQIACQYKNIDGTSLMQDAYGILPNDTPANGRSIEGQAFRSSP
jgi:hypothetical protein